MQKIEYDDGVTKRPKGQKPEPYCTPRGRQRGFYTMRDGDCYRIPIGFMRVSEMGKLEKLLNILCDKEEK